MKKLIFSLFMLYGLIGYGQIPYIDVLTAPAMVTYAQALKNQQNKTNDNLSAIQRAQTAMMTQLGVANNLHDKVVRGLTEVSGTLNNALTVKEIYSSSLDIVNNTKDALDLAVGNPALTLFAIRSSHEFKRRALGLTAEVTRILTGGESNMMDAGERQKLLNYIHTEIRLLSATAYGVRYNMEYAKRYGIWNTLNPFRAWINQDTRIMQDIISQAKLI